MAEKQQWEAKYEFYKEIFENSREESIRNGFALQNSTEEFQARDSELARQLAAIVDTNSKEYKQINSERKARREEHNFETKEINALVNNFNQIKINLPLIEKQKENRDTYQEILDELTSKQAQNAEMIKYREELSQEATRLDEELQELKEIEEHCNIALNNPNATPEQKEHAARVLQENRAKQNENQTKFSEKQLALQKELGKPLMEVPEEDIVELKEKIDRANLICELLLEGRTMGEIQKVVIPKEKLGDKPEQKPGEKPEQKPGEKPEQTPGEKPEQRTGEKPEQTLGEKPEQKPGEKPEQTPGEKPEQKTGEKPEQTPGEKPEQRTGEKPEQTPGEKPEQKPGEKPEQTPGEKPEQKTGEKPEQTSGEKPEQTSGEKPEQKPGEKPEQTPEQSKIKAVEIVINKDGSSLSVARENPEKNLGIEWHSQRESDKLASEYKLEPLEAMDKEIIERVSSIGDKYVIRGIVRAAHEKRFSPKEAYAALMVYENLLKGDLNYENTIFDIYYDVRDLKGADLTKEERKELLHNAKKARDFGAFVDAKFITKMAWKMQDIAKAIGKGFTKGKKKAITERKTKRLNAGGKFLKENRENSKEKSENDNEKQVAQQPQEKNAHEKYTEQLQIQAKSAEKTVKEQQSEKQPQQKQEPKREQAERPQQSKVEEKKQSIDEMISDMPDFSADPRVHDMINEMPDFSLDPKVEEELRQQPLPRQMSDFSDNAR